MNWKHCINPPKIVCLCGSTRFMDQFFRSGWEETLAGNIVLSVGVVVEDQLPSSMLPNERGHVGEALGLKDELDELHFRKIDLADDVLILNVDGYVGKSTQREVAYAIATGKPVRWLDQTSGKAVLEARSHQIGKQVATFLAGEIPAISEAL